MKKNIREKSEIVALVTSNAFSLINFRAPLIAEMIRSGKKVLAFAPDYDENLRAEVMLLGAEPIDFKLSRAGVNPIKDLLDGLNLYLLLRKLKPDVTLCYLIKPVIYGTIAAWLARIPCRFVLIEGLGYAFNNLNEKKQNLKSLILFHLVSRLYGVALKKAHKAVFLNDDDKNEFINAGIVSHEKTYCLGGIGVDLNNWHPTQPILSPVTFLLAARLIREKGIFEYINAAREVKKDYPEVRFILIGGIDLNPGSLAHSEVEAWVDEGLIEWPGHVSDVRSWLAESSVFVLPSFYREGVPRSIQEAMAMALPIITTNSVGCKETVIDGVNGYLIPPKNYQALAIMMRRFINSPELIAQMGVKSRLLAEDRYDVYKVNKRLMSYLEL